MDYNPTVFKSNIGDSGDDGDSNIAVIAGAVAGGCVLLIFVVVAIIMCRR